MPHESVADEHLRKKVEEFLSRRTRVSDVDDEFLTQLARFRHPANAEGMRGERQINEIVEVLGFANPMQVSRLLQRARERGIICVHIQDAKGDALREQLRQQFPFLKRIETVPSDKDNSHVRQLLGKKMAEVFDGICEERGSISVTLGGGRTVRKFVASLEEKSRSTTISPMALFTRSEIGEVYDSAYLSMVVHWISGESSSAFICALPPLPNTQRKAIPISIAALTNYCHSLYEENNKVREVFEKSCSPDVAIFGVADLNEKSSIIPAVYNRIGFPLKKLRELGAIADMNYTVLTEDGSDLAGEIVKELKIRHKIPNHSHPFLLAVSIERLRQLSRETKPEKDIFVVAGSAHKFRAIRAVLRGKIANCIVTDEETAARLIREP